MTKQRRKATNDMIDRVTQRGEAVPSGYTFDPRQNPPLFPTEPVVAQELRKEVESETAKGDE
jgi:hypothetical protein